MNWHNVARCDQVKPGQPLIVTVQGKQVGLFHEGGDYFAVLDFCPHAGAPICRGRVSGAVACDEQGNLRYDHDRQVLRCPWHHWEFDLRTGKALLPIREKLRTYPIRVEDDHLLVQI